MRTFDIVLACDNEFGIGVKGNIPWRDTPIGKADMKWFSRLTNDSVVIMGRLTWESIGKPLQNRINIIVTSREIKDQMTFKNLDSALEYSYSLNKKVFVIGGARLFEEAFKKLSVGGTVYLTRIKQDFLCDVKVQIPNYNFFRSELMDLEFGIYWFKEAVLKVELCDVEMGRKGLSMEEFIRRTSSKSFLEGEMAYLDLIDQLMKNPPRGNRTNIQTKSCFAKTLRFNIGGGMIPALTTKFVSLKAVIVELLWFLRAEQNIDYLKKHDVHIWDGNTSREFLDKIGHQDKSEGYCGPIYGCQWRNWNNKGIDQLQKVIDILKTNPNDRRMVVSAWNPEVMDDIVLPSCHHSFQFYVNDEQRLCCFVNMRSADVGLGVPFNIASYAILTHIIGQITGYKRGDLVISMVDCHLYVNHENGLKEQLKRDVSISPTLNFSKRVQEKKDLCLDDFAKSFDYTDFVIENYYCGKTINLEMAV